MKLKRILGGVLAGFMAMTALSVPTFAADPIVNVYVKAPTDLSGNALTSIKAGDAFALPIDATSTDGVMDVVNFSLYFDTTKLDSGITYNTALDAYADDVDTYFSITTTDMVTGGVTPRGFVKSVSSSGRTTYFKAADITISTREVADGKVDLEFVGGTLTGYDTSAENEFVFFFTAKQDIDSLNADVLAKADVNSSQGNPTTDKTGATHYAASTEKMNACYGAFQVKIDTTNGLKDADGNAYWIQELYASVNGGEKVQLTEYVNQEGTAVYAFPTRITTNASGVAATDDVTVTITATTTSDEAGTTGQKTDVPIAQQTIKLNQPTAYEDIIK